MSSVHDQGAPGQAVSGGPAPGVRAPGRSGEPVPTPVDELSFADASAELDGIVALFEEGDVDVDRLVRHLERATAIVDELDRRIRSTRAQVEQLIPRLARVSDDAPAPQGPDGAPWDAPAGD